MIRSETVVLRRSIDEKKKKTEESSNKLKHDENSDQSVSRSKTVLLKSTAGKDQQGLEQDVEDGSLGANRNER